MEKFKVGDKVKYSRYTGVVVEVNSGSDHNLILCRFNDFRGHKGNGHTNRGKDYDTNDYYYCRPELLELIEENKYIFKYHVGDEVLIGSGRILIIRECCTSGTYAGTYRLNNGLHYKEDKLTLVESATKSSYVDDLKMVKENTNKESKVKENVKAMSRNVQDIRIGSKTVIVPQEKNAPKKVECKTVIMTVDGKDYEAVCMPGDEFDLKTGIEVALIKCLFGGTTQYEKYVRNLIKFYETCEKKREEEKRIVEKREKNIARKMARKEKKANEERQARIDEMSEAFLKAMRDYDGIGMDSMIDEDTTHCVPFDIEKMCQDFLTTKGLVAVPADTVDNTDDLK